MSGSQQRAGVSERLASLDVDSVFVYVGDAVRLDDTPQLVTDRGVTLNTVAASTHSPTSFASLVTGRHPPGHGVEFFQHSIDGSVFRLFDLDDVETLFVNSVSDGAGNDPIFDVLGVDPVHNVDPLECVSEPFAVMERGPGGHAPYGDYDGTAKEYFGDRGHLSDAEIRAEYETALTADAELFERRLETLREFGRLEDTLVVYTSDHGELLGEGGGVGHNFPMRPELVYVPTVFVHPELQSECSEVLMRHVDLLPTVLSALGRTDAARSLDGQAIQNRDRDRPDPPGLTFYDRSYPTRRLPGLSGTLSYRGAWDGSGGHVYAESSLADRLAVYASKLAAGAKSSFLRRRPVVALRSFLRGDHTYGSPSFDRDHGEELLETAESESRSTSRRDLSEAQRQQLRDLGYVE